MIRSLMIFCALSLTTIACDTDVTSAPEPIEVLSHDSAASSEVMTVGFLILPPLDLMLELFVDKCELDEDCGAGMICSLAYGGNTICELQLESMEPIVDIE